MFYSYLTKHDALRSDLVTWDGITAAPECLCVTCHSLGCLLGSMSPFLKGLGSGTLSSEPRKGDGFYPHRCSRCPWVRPPPSQRLIPHGVACFLELLQEKTKLSRKDKLWRRRRKRGDSHSGSIFIKTMIAGLERAQLPTVQSTHLVDLSDFLVPHSESQGIFAHQRHSVQPFFPSFKNKAHKSRPHPRGQKCYELVT